MDNWGTYKGLNRLEKQMQDVAEFAANPDRVPPKDSIFSPPPVMNPYNRIDVGIYDESQPDGKMHGQNKRKSLLKGLFEMMYRDLMSDADISPKFNWSAMVDGVMKFIAIGESSAEYLVDIVERMPSPWPGAQLCVKYRSEKLHIVEAFVPGEMKYIKETLEKINQFDYRIETWKWHAIRGRPHGGGYVYTFSISDADLKRLNNHNGYIPYDGTRVEFRVLNNDNLM